MFCLFIYLIFHIILFSRKVTINMETYIKTFLPRTFRVIVNDVLPTLFSRVSVYSPASVLITLPSRQVVMFRIVCTSILFLSGSLPPLYTHVTVGCGLPLNGISKAVDWPRLRVTVSSNFLSKNNSGGTRIQTKFHSVCLFQRF